MDGSRHQDDMQRDCLDDPGRTGYCWFGRTGTRRKRHHAAGGLHHHRIGKNCFRGVSILFFIESQQDEESGEQQEITDDSLTFDFAEILYLGLQFGLREREIGHLTYGKWTVLYRQYRKVWNMRVKRMIFEEQEPVTSSLDL